MLLNQQLLLKLKEFMILIIILVLILKIFVSKIKWVEAYGDYIKIVTDEESHLVLSTMKGFEKELPENKFLRIHKSYIVNLAKVSSIDGNRVYMGDRSFPIGATYRGAFMNLVKLHMG